MTILSSYQNHVFAKPYGCPDRFFQVDAPARPTLLDRECAYFALDVCGV